MKTQKYFLLLVMLFSTLTKTFSQVEMDKSIQLTGSGTDAAIHGIQSVTGIQDAVSVEYLQKGSFMFAESTGSAGDFSISIAPSISAYEPGMTFRFISNHQIDGSATLNVNGLGPVPIKKFASASLTNCDIVEGQIVTVVYDGTNFQMTSAGSSSLNPTVAYAGLDQTVNGTSTFLDANIPVSGNGMWSVVDGFEGTFDDPSDPHTAYSTPSGTFQSESQLRWTITSSPCGSSSADVVISMSLSVTPGGPYTFTVPDGVYSINADVSGAQGGSFPSLDYFGGLGGRTQATLSVTPGQELYIYVGEQPLSNIGGFNGGGNGGGTGMGGGGASDIRIGGYALEDRVIVAGGGGGVSIVEGWGLQGGAGGGITGGNGTSYNGPDYCGSGGTDTAGGAGEIVYGNSGSGSLGLGGNGGNGNGSGGAGGGGYYGGGGGDAGAGGGGSAYVTPVGTSAITYSSGVREGNGFVTLSW